jgi:hypothetical protein
MIPLVAALAIGAVLGAAVSYPAGVSQGRKEYENRKEILRDQLIQRLSAIPIPEWLVLPDLLNWLRTVPSEEVLKWVLQTLNMVIDQWESQSQFITALMESLKVAFNVPPPLSVPRITRKTIEKIVAKELPEPRKPKIAPVIY